jgi:hypothetical protein
LTSWTSTDQRFSVVMALLDKSWQTILQLVAAY